MATLKYSEAKVAADAHGGAGVPYVPQDTELISFAGIGNEAYAQEMRTITKRYMVNSEFEAITGELVFPWFNGPTVLLSPAGRLLTITSNADTGQGGIIHTMLFTEDATGVILVTVTNDFNADIFTKDITYRPDGTFRRGREWVKT